MGEAWCDWHIPWSLQPQLQGFWTKPRGAWVVSALQWHWSQCRPQCAPWHTQCHSANVCLKPPAVPCRDCESRNTKFLPCRAFPAPLQGTAGPGLPSRSSTARGQQVPSAQRHPRVHTGGVLAAILCHQAWGSVSWNVLLPWKCWRSLLGNASPSPSAWGCRSCGQPSTECSEQAWHTHPLFSLRFLEEKTKAKQDFSHVLKVRAWFSDQLWGQTCCASHYSCFSQVIGDGFIQCIFILWVSFSWHFLNFLTYSFHYCEIWLQNQTKSQSKACFHHAISLQASPISAWGLHGERIDSEFANWQTHEKYSDLVWIPLRIFHMFKGLLWFFSPVYLLLHIVK